MKSADEAELVAAIYDAALNHRSWQEVADRFVRLLGARTFFLALHKPAGRATDLVADIGFKSQVWQAYE